MRERAEDGVGEGNMQVGGRLGSPRAIRWRKGELIGAGTVDCLWFRIRGLWVPAVRFVGEWRCFDRCCGAASTLVEYVSVKNVG